MLIRHSECSGRRFLRHALLGLAGAGAALSMIGGAGADQAGAARRGSPHVVELFTSQGCSNCPPADRLISEFAHDPDTIALSFAVNYWDYIGWKDTLASPVFTARQNAYAVSRGDRQVYTPQVIVDGRQVEPGADKSAILRDVAANVADQPVAISIGKYEGWMKVHIGNGAPDPSGPAGVYLLRVERTKTVQIGRGENSGRSVTYTNVVRALNKLGDWNGRPVDFQTLDLRGDDEGYVVLLQRGGADRPGAIIAATRTSDLEPGQTGAAAASVSN